MLRLAGGGAPGVALIAVGITAGCSIYQPLDQGSRVPWAQAQAAAPRRGVAASRRGLGSRCRTSAIACGAATGWAISPSHGVTVAALAQANDLSHPTSFGWIRSCDSGACVGSGSAPGVASRAVPRSGRIDRGAAASAQDHGTARVTPGPQEVAALEEAAPPSGPRPTRS